jgi:hypothetical protein
MTLCNLVTLHGNKHVTKSCRANAQSCIFSITVVFCVSLLIADVSNYSNGSVLVHERQLTGKTKNLVMTAF